MDSNLEKFKMADIFKFAENNKFTYEQIMAMLYSLDLDKDFFLFLEDKLGDLCLPMNEKKKIKFSGVYTCAYIESQEKGEKGCCGLMVWPKDCSFQIQCGFHGAIRYRFFCTKHFEQILNQKKIYFHDFGYRCRWIIEDEISSANNKDVCNFLRETKSLSVHDYANNLCIEDTFQFYAWGFFRERKKFFCPPKNSHKKLCSKQDVNRGKNIVSPCKKFAAKNDIFCTIHRKQLSSF